MRYCLTVGRAVLLEQPLSANAAADAPLLAHSAVQVEVQGQVLTCIEIVACFYDGAVALQGGSGSAIAVDGCLSVAAKFILPYQHDSSIKRHSLQKGIITDYHYNMS